MIRSLRPAAKRIQGCSQFAAAASSGIQQRDINYNVAFLFPGQGGIYCDKLNKIFDNK